VPVQRLSEVANERDSRVVDEDVDPAKMFDGRRHRPYDIIPFG
jgi:hypothetical protein